MRKGCLLILFVSFFVVHVFAVTKTWTGASGGIWSDPGNWSPAGVPVLGDDVIFNTSVTVAIDVSPIALNSLHFINNINVLFQTDATRNFRLSGTAAANPALLIEAGSVFTFDGINAGGNNSSLNLTYGSGVIGSIFGTLIISKTGGSSATPGIQLITDNDATNYGVVTVYAGGAIKIFPGGGNTSSSLTPVPTLIMKDGSLYENLKNGGSFPMGIWEDNSLAKASSPGSNGPGFNGIVYGNLEWNCPFQTAALFLSNNVSFNNASFISTNNVMNNGELRIKSGPSNTSFSMTVRRNLFISTNSRIRITSNSVVSGYGGSLILQGNLDNQGTITTDGMVGTINNLILNGTTNQNIVSSGTISGAGNGLTQGLNFIMDNADGVTLLSPVTLPYMLTLINGKIKTTSTNVLIMADNTITSGGSSNSFVDGPMKKEGDDAGFLFPVGTGSIYAPISFYSPGGMPSDVYYAEYLRASPQNAYGVNYDPMGNPEIIHHISFVEYWKLKKLSGSISNLNVTLTVSFYSFSTDLNTTFAAKFDLPAGQWKNCGTANRTSTGFISAYETGTVKTTDFLTITDSIFTLATDQLVSVNPLPVNLVDFNVIKISPAVAGISWQLAQCCSKDARFEIQKSTDNSNFVSFANITGSETNRFYSYNDTRLGKGITYYRLKMIDVDEKVSYSKIVVIVNETKNLFITSLSPNPVTSHATFTISSAKEEAINFSIYNAAGIVVKQWQQSLRGGIAVIHFDAGKLKAGVYYLSAVSTDNHSVITFVKQ